MIVYNYVVVEHWSAPAMSSSGIVQKYRTAMVIFRAKLKVSHCNRSLL